MVTERVAGRTCTHCWRAWGEPCACGEPWSADEQACPECGGQGVVWGVTDSDLVPCPKCGFDDAPDAQGDRPRKIIVCNPADAPAIQRGVVHDLGHSDVLVVPNEHIEQGHSYVIDGDAFDVI